MMQNFDQNEENALFSVLSKLNDLSTCELPSYLEITSGKKTERNKRAETKKH